MPERSDRSAAPPAALLLLLGALAALPVRAQEPVPGLPAGPWILAPRASFEMYRDSNLFRARQSTGQAERYSVLGAGLRATLPFRNSLLQLNLSQNKQSYNHSQVFARDDSRDLGVALHLNFSTGDRLTVGARRRDDFSRIQEEALLGNELVFTGQPYQTTEAQLEIFREIPDHPGYWLRVVRTTFDFRGEGDRTGGLVDYDGTDSALEYRHPLPGSRWWIVYLGQRRFDYDVPDALGTITTRHERNWSVQTGLRGRLGPEQYFFVRVGYGRLGLEEEIESSYRGLSGEAGWKTELGARTRVEVQAERIPLPSVFESFYINSEIQARLERDILRNAVAGLHVAAGHLRYGLAGRNDDHRRFGADLSWRFTGRVGVRASVEDDRRRSDVAGDYDAMVVGVGLLYGWY